jgi:hypothetical protein
VLASTTSSSSSSALPSTASNKLLSVNASNDIAHKPHGELQLQVSPTPSSMSLDLDSVNIFEVDWREATKGMSREDRARERRRIYDKARYWRQKLEKVSTAIDSHLLRVTYYDTCSNEML